MMYLGDLGFILEPAAHSTAHAERALCTGTAGSQPGHSRVTAGSQPGHSRVIEIAKETYIHTRNY